jgi:hypothetical protein
VLDPRIGYTGLKDDYTNDPDLLDGLERSKVALESHFNQFYTGRTSLASPSTTPQSFVANLSSDNPQPHDFTARFRTRPKPLQNEIEEFFSLFPQDFMSCNPVQWWYSNRSRFPNLYRLARDVLAIPGEYECTYRMGDVRLILYQDQQLLWNGSFLEEETPFLSDVPVSNPTLFVFSC